MTKSSTLLLILLSAGALAACNGKTTCDLNGEEAKFEAVVQQNLACSVDDDCTVTSPPSGGGTCVFACGTLTNKSGAAAVQSAATSICETYLSDGCPAPPVPNCPTAGGLPLCAKGTCTTYLARFEAPPMSVALDACTAFKLDFEIGFDHPTAAPRDMTVAMTVNGGTLYADSACKTPMGSQGTLTIPAGASSVAFGFMATAPGTCSINAGPQGGGDTATFVAQ
jgi:hypothetical protein